jgi:hypothetical protein
MNRLFTLIALSLVAGVAPLVLAQTKPGGPSNKMTCEEALKQAPIADKDLVPLAKTFNDADAKLKKTPKNAAAQKVYVDTGFKYGDTLMHLPNGKLTPAIQYRAALALFRRVLAVNPKHSGSLAEKKAIDDIYAGMGGIPK